MFIRKFLNASKVDDVNAKGRFIKVMNCESVIRLRVTYQGNLVLDSDAKAGFDVQTSQPFDQIQITSETEQKLELWVSEHKLSYDALSTKANSSSSFLVEHFGDEQQILTYDPSQARARVVVDEKPCWIGGEGVTKENGLFLQQSTVYIHDSASPLYAFLDERPQFRLQPASAEIVKGLLSSDYEVNTYSTSFVLNGEVSCLVNEIKGGEFNKGTQVQVLNMNSKALNTFYIRGFSSVVKFGNGFAGIYLSTGTRIGIAGGSERDELDLTFVDVDLSGSALTNISSLAGDGVSIYAFGTHADPDNNRKYAKVLSDLSVVYKDLPQGMTPQKIYRSDIDPYTGDIYIYNGDSIGFFVEDSNVFNEIVTNVKPEATGFFFNENFVYWGESNKWALYSRSDGVLRYFNCRALLVDSTGETVVLVQTNKIQKSIDSGLSFVDVKNFDSSIFKTAYAGFGSPFVEYKGAVYFSCVDVTGEAEQALLEIPAFIDKSKPRAKIRVFKESF